MLHDMADSCPSSPSFLVGSSDSSSGMEYVLSNESASGVSNHPFGLIRGSVTSSLSLVDSVPSLAVNSRFPTVLGLSRLNYSTGSSAASFVSCRWSSCPCRAGGIVGMVDREGGFHNRLLAHSFAEFLSGSSLHGSSVVPSRRVVAGGFSSAARGLLDPSEQESIVSDDNSSVTSDSDISDGSGVLSHSLGWRQLVATEYCASCRRGHRRPEHRTVVSAQFSVFRDPVCTAE